jgi:hypothetical protein
VRRPDFLSRWWNVCKLFPPDEHFASGMPFNAGDQDVLTALLLSEIPREALVLLPEGEEVFGGTPGSRTSRRSPARRPGDRRRSFTTSTARSPASHRARRRIRPAGATYPVAVGIETSSHDWRSHHDTSAPAVAAEVDGVRQRHQDVSVDVTFYTVSNHTYFLGTVALLNSLRVTGNSEPLVVLDAGLLPEERAALESQTTVVSMPEDRGNPVLLKPFPHVLDASGIIVVIDSDIIVTSSLASITDLGREGKICICPAWVDAARTRWFPEWEETLQLRAPLRREEWFHDGFVVFDTRRWPGLLQRWWEVCELVPSEEISASGGAPFNAGDADAINALLMSEVPREGVEVLAQGDEVYAGDVTIDDLETLACSVQGRPARFIHVPDRPKP